MKKYYYKNTRGFANTYIVCWAESPAQIAYAESHDYDQITRRDAEKLCAAENRRRKYDQSCSGYASTVIKPIDFDSDWLDPDRDLDVSGYIAEYSTAKAAATAADILANPDKYRI